MKAPRRDFIRTMGTAAATTAFAPWMLEIEAAQNAAIDVNKNTLADAALGTARRLGASYADIRINRYRFESVMTREKQVQSAARNQDFGFGVRVLVKGAWGFAASPTVNEAEVRRVTQIACEVAVANAAFQRKPVTLAPVTPVKANWKSAFTTDPFDVPLDQKIQFLLGLNETAMTRPGVSFVNSWQYWVNEQRFLATSDGSRIEQYLIRGEPGFNITAVSRETGDFQSRRSLNPPQAIGYEYMDKGLWMEDAFQAADEAVLKLKAKSVEAGKYDLILHPSHLWLTIHESIGHSTELDRALWLEANHAGTSFLTPDKIGTRIGTPIVNFFADRTQPHGLATVGFDDEGVPGQRWYLVKDGMFVDWQTTRELAGVTGRNSSYGCLHAQSWSNVPFARMPNVSLEPASSEVSLDALVGGVDRGILIFGDGSFSIDQQRYNFQFGGQTFWEIRSGKVAGMLRDVAYQSRTPDFWDACDGLGGQSMYLLGGVLSDGKGEPRQTNAVSHGCPVARFRQINVLNTAAPLG